MNRMPAAVKIDVAEVVEAATVRPPVLRLVVNE